MGGFYERLVGLVKPSLRKSIGKISLNIVQLETILTAVEIAVNSRPLVHVGADLNSVFALTPGDFLNLNPNTGVPSVRFNLQKEMFYFWKKVHHVAPGS